MPNKDFEEQIRDGLRDWAIEPSDATRAKVLEAVRRKDRRRGFLWIPLGLLLLALGTWGGLQMFRHAGTATRNAKMQGAAPASQGGPAKGSPGANNFRPAGKQAATNTRLAENNARSLNAPSTINYGQGLTDAAVHGAADAPGQIHSDIKLPLLPGLAFFDISPIRQSPATGLSPGKAGDTISKNRSAEKWPNTGKWALRGYLGGGIAGQGRFGQFHYGGGVVPTPSVPAAYVGIPAGRANLDTLASVKPGAGLQAGVQGIFRISRHIQWSAGLEYDHWQVTISRVKQNAPPPPVIYYANFFTASRGSAGQTFINRYNLLQLPLDINWSLAPEQAWNPSLFTGLSLGYVFPRENLMYNTEGAGYAKSSTLSRRWSLTWEAGANLDLLKFGNYVLGGGPVFQYGLLTIQKNPPVPDHFNYLGLRLSLTRPVLKH